MLKMFWNELLPNFIKNIIKFFMLNRYIKYSYKTIWVSKLTHINITSLINKQIHFGKEVYLWRDTYMSWNIHIWNYCFIWPNSDIASWDTVKVTIWNFCSIARNCTMIASNYHDKNKLTTRSLPGLNIKEIWKNITLWNDVWIGSNVTILYWVSIWNGAIIWAWSIVTKDIPAYWVAVWNPAKVFSTRFDADTKIKLEESKWWDWEIEKIIQNYDLNFCNNTKWNSQ